MFPTESRSGRLGADMKIVVIRLHSLAPMALSEPVSPAWAPGATWTTDAPSLGTSYVEVSTDEGITGYGPMVSAELLEGAIAPYLMGRDPFAVEENIIVLRNAGGGWGLEIALWDIIGKACGQPLYRLWGGYKDRVRAYASCVEVRSGERRAEDALRCLDDNWRAIKPRIHAWERDRKSVG